MADEAFENVEICTTLKLGSLVAGQYLNTLTNLSHMKYLSLQKKFSACKNFKYTVANSKFLTKQTNVIKVMLPVLPKSILSVYIYLLLIL